MRAILLIMIGLSWLYSAEIFTDKTTGLVWQDKSVKKEWNDAKEYCQNLIFEGKSDWRLPSTKELQSIVDIKKYDPAIKDGFKNVTSNVYWSSYENVSSNSEAWCVYFKSGRTSHRNKSYKLYVRCVRGR